jgi:addiction module HigA family antidote
VARDPKLSPIHPGEFLLEEFMKPLGLSQNALARALGVPPGRIGEIVNGKRAITGDTALRLERYFGASAKMWLNLQARYELESAQDTVGDKIKASVRPRERASARG